jgi:predicted TPR repeat methyltransferase
LQRPAEAEHSFRLALERNQDYALAHSSLGIALKAQNRGVEAERSFRVALRLDPDDAGSHNLLGVVLMDQGHLGDAEICFRRALDTDANQANAASNLGLVLGGQGKRAEALAHYRDLVEKNPQDEIARHYFHAFSGSAPDSAPRAYVSNLFDNFAGSFEAHLVDNLNYRVPENLVPLILDQQSATGKVDLLDLGCGTGLLGAAIAAHTRELVGIDLSAKMLDKARGRGVYTRLQHADLLDALTVEPPARYDVVTAADVFVYVGRIDTVVAQVKRVLRPGALFGFSVEAADALAEGQGDIPDTRLLTSGRYAHSAAYLHRLAQDNGFSIVEFLESVIRMERSAPIAGWLVVWRA